MQHPVKLRYFITWYTNILPGLFSTPEHLTGICRIPSTSGSPLHTAPGEENPSRPFKLSPEHPAEGSWTASWPGIRKTGLIPQEIALGEHDNPCWYYVHYNIV